LKAWGVGGDRARGQETQCRREVRRRTQPWGVRIPWRRLGKGWLPRNRKYGQHCWTEKMRGERKDGGWEEKGIDAKRPKEKGLSSNKQMRSSAQISSDHYLGGTFRQGQATPQREALAPHQKKTGGPQVLLPFCSRQSKNLSKQTNGARGKKKMSPGGTESSKGPSGRKVRPFVSSRIQRHILGKVRKKTLPRSGRGRDANRGGMVWG